MPVTTEHDPGAQPTARFTPAELSYLLSERRLGRLATADGTGVPHVVPVGWSYYHDLGAIEMSGRNFADTRKFRNVQANPYAAFVVDDVLPPFRRRCVMVRGVAHALGVSEGAGAMIRIVPTKIISWGLEDATVDRVRTGGGSR